MLLLRILGWLSVSSCVCAQYPVTLSAADGLDSLLFYSAPFTSDKSVSKRNFPHISQGNLHLGQQSNSNIFRNEIPVSAASVAQPLVASALHQPGKLLRELFYQWLRCNNRIFKVNFMQIVLLAPLVLRESAPI